MDKSWNIRKKLEALKRAEADSGVSAREVNQVLLQGLIDTHRVDNNSVILEVNSQLTMMHGQIALLIERSGHVHKAVSEDAAKEMGLFAPYWQVEANGRSWYIYQELGVEKSNGHGYHAIKMPYTKAFWQPYRHQLVAKAFGLLDNYPLCGDWVINHKGGKQKGDSLDNLEVVTYKENELHGKLVNNLMNDYSFIKSVTVSAKDADILKKFYDPICGVIEGKVNRTSKTGCVYMVKDVKIVKSADSTVINMTLYHGDKYCQPLSIEVDRGGWTL